MNKYIDLHTHSTESDGSMHPRELVRYAKGKGLSAIALTDHDTVEGIKAAMDEGLKVGLEVLAGIEISVDYRPEMHILGYFPEDKYENIKDPVLEFKNGREKRNVKIVNKLTELGIEITLEDVIAEAWGGIIGRPHIAKVLLKKGFVKSIDEAFEKYLCSGGAAYFRREELSPENGIQAILKAGGVPVLAHPIYLGKSYAQLDELLGTLVTFGLNGIEAHYVGNTGDDTGNLLRLALKHKLLVTGGSDFHGNLKPDVEIGIGHGNLQIPYELLERLMGI